MNLSINSPDHCSRSIALKKKMIVFYMASCGPSISCCSIPFFFFLHFCLKSVHIVNPPHKNALPSFSHMPQSTITLSLLRATAPFIPCSGSTTYLPFIARRSMCLCVHERLFDNTFPTLKHKFHEWRNQVW